MSKKVGKRDYDKVMLFRKVENIVATTQGLDLSDKDGRFVLRLTDPVRPAVILFYSGKIKDVYTYLRGYIKQQMP